METQSPPKYFSITLNFRQLTSIYLFAVSVLQAVSKMVTRFERPFVLFAPQVYSSFKLRNPETNEDEEFFIQDMPEDRFEEGARFMVKYYTKHETFLNAHKAPEEAFMDFYRFVFKQKIALACFKMDNNELVAINMLSVKSKGRDTSFKVSQLMNSTSCLNNQFMPLE